MVSVRLPFFKRAVSALLKRAVSSLKGLADVSETLTRSIRYLAEALDSRRSSLCRLRRCCQALGMRVTQCMCFTVRSGHHVECVLQKTCALLFEVNMNLDA